MSEPLSLPTDVRTATYSERIDAGVAARQRRPRTALADWTPAADRKDPVTLLAEQEVGRVAELLPVRHERMSASAFAFYRGAAAIMAADLGSMPNTGLVVQLCGDAHVANFGLFAGQDRSVVFDVNDFDETNPGPFEWDVLRLAASFTLAAQDNGYTSEEAALMAKTAARAYRQSMAQFASMGDLAIWYDRISSAELTNWAQLAGGDKGIKSVSRIIDKARTRDSWSAVSKLTEVVDGKRRFLDQPPLLVSLPADDPQSDGQMHELMRQYRDSLQDDRRELIRRYSMVDLGHKVVGVGSVGLRAWVVLLQGRDPDDLLVLQGKEAVHSVLEPYTGASQFDHMGQRVVNGQRLMQAASDAFLGWITGFRGREYYVRQLRDMKWSPDLAKLSPAVMVGYAELCGRTLAHGHARSGDAVAIAGYLATSEKFDESVSVFATKYTARVQADYHEYLAAISDGRVSVAAESSLTKEMIIRAT